MQGNHEFHFNSLNRYFGEPGIALSIIKLVGQLSSGVTVDLDSIAAPFPRECFGHLFQSSSTAPAPEGLTDAEIADPTKVSLQGQLRDKVQRDEPQNFPFVNRDKQPRILVFQVPLNFAVDESIGIVVIQFAEQPRNRFPITPQCFSYLHADSV